MSNTVNIFETASSKKLRFATTRGLLSVEDLWDLSLESLDTLARAINKELKSTQEESFIPATTTRKRGASEMELKLEILKSIIGTRVEERDAAKSRADKRAAISRLKELAAKKADEALASKSLEEIQSELAALGEDADEEE